MKMDYKSKDARNLYDLAQKILKIARKYEDTEPDLYEIFFR